MLSDDRLRELRAGWRHQAIVAGIAGPDSAEYEQTCEDTAAAMIELMDARRKLAEIHSAAMRCLQRGSYDSIVFERIRDLTETQ